MSYTPGFSGSLHRTDSMDHSKNNDEYETQTSCPGVSSVGITRETEYHVQADGERTVKAVETHPAPAPQPDAVRPATNSINQFTGETGSKGLDPNSYDNPQAYSFGDHARQNNSRSVVGDVTSYDDPAPTLSGAAHREGSTNGTIDDSGSINPLDYVGISLVGKRFKMVNPEAYYVEKDDEPAPY